MKTIELTLYTINELSENARQKAIQELSDINVDYNWWEFTYEDAKEIGLKITSFELDRNRYAEGKFEEYSYEVAQNIINNHGESTETYKIAQNFIIEYKKTELEYNEDDENNDVIDNEREELEQFFLCEILEEYSLILQREYEYLISDEAILKTIEANEYLFTENGKMY
jgi:hypothetical protein